MGEIEEAKDLIRQLIRENAAMQKACCLQPLRTMKTTTRNRTGSKEQRIS